MIDPAKIMHAVDESCTSWSSLLVARLLSFIRAPTTFAQPVYLSVT